MCKMKMFQRTTIVPMQKFIVALSLTIHVGCMFNIQPSVVHVSRETFAAKECLTVEGTNDILLCQLKVDGDVRFDEFWQTIQSLKRRVHGWQLAMDGVEVDFSPGDDGDYPYAGLPPEQNVCVEILSDQDASLEIALVGDRFLRTDFDFVDVFLRVGSSVRMETVRRAMLRLRDAFGLNAGFWLKPFNERFRVLTLRPVAPGRSLFSKDDRGDTNFAPEYETDSESSVP